MFLGTSFPGIPFSPISRLAEIFLGKESSQQARWAAHQWGQAKVDAALFSGERSATVGNFSIYALIQVLLLEWNNFSFTTVAMFSDCERSAWLPNTDPWHQKTDCFDNTKAPPIEASGYFHAVVEIELHICAERSCFSCGAAQEICKRHGMADRSFHLRSS